MSFARWGKNCDLYLFSDVAGGITCCGCLLSDEESEDAYFRAYSFPELEQHLRAHEQAGHQFPPHLLDPDTYDPRIRKYDPFARTKEPRQRRH